MATNNRKTALETLRGCFSSPWGKKVMSEVQLPHFSLGGWGGVSSGGGGVDGETQRTLLKVSIIWAAKFTRGCLAW